MGFLDRILGRSTVTDPVCKMKIDPKKAKETTTFENTTYYFCSTGCRTTFESDPQKYTRT